MSVAAGGGAWPTATGAGCRTTVVLQAARPSTRTPSTRTPRTRTGGSNVRVRMAPALFREPVTSLTMRASGRRGGRMALDVDSGGPAEGAGAPGALQGVAARIGHLGGLAPRARRGLADAAATRA